MTADFWEDMSIKYNFEETYKQYMTMKKRINRHYCFKCKETCCCNVWSIMNTHLTLLCEVDKSFSRYISIGDYLKRTKCLFLTKDFRCMVEHCKPERCFEWYCYRVQGTKSYHRNVRNNMQNAKHDIRRFDGDKLRREYIGWLQDHPEFVQSIKEQLEGRN